MWWYCGRQENPKATKVLFWITPLRNKGLRWINLLGCVIEHPWNSFSPACRTESGYWVAWMSDMQADSICNPPPTLAMLSYITRHRRNMFRSCFVASVVVLGEGGSCNPTTVGLPHNHCLFILNSSFRISSAHEVCYNCLYLRERSWGVFPTYFPLLVSLTTPTRWMVQCDVWYAAVILQEQPFG